MTSEYSADKARTGVIVNLIVSVLVFISSTVMGLYHWIHRFGWGGADVPADETAKSYSLWTAIFSTIVSIGSGITTWYNVFALNKFEVGKNGQSRARTTAGGQAANGAVYLPVGQ